MPLPRFRLRTLMIAVAVIAVLLPLLVEHGQFILFVFLLLIGWLPAPNK